MAIQALGKRIEIIMVLFNPKKLKVLQCTTSPILREQSTDVKEFDKTLSDLSQSLMKLMKNETTGVETVGISAVQVGINIKLCICENPVNGKKIAMVNPEILDASIEMGEELEGCISIGEGDKQLFAYVPRPKEVSVRFFDLKGNEQFVTAKNLYSHIIQHEIDHMHGKLFIDYIDDPNEIMTLAELEERTKKKDLHLSAI